MKGCLTAVLLQARNLKVELKFLFRFRPEAVCQQKQNQIPTFSPVYTYIYDYFLADHFEMFFSFTAKAENMQGIMFV